MKTRIQFALILALTGAGVAILFAQAGPMNALNLPVITNSSNALFVSGAAATGTQNSPRNLANTLLKTDSTGGLVVTIVGGTTTPTLEQVGSGNCANPMTGGYSFASDTDTGWYNIAANQIAPCTGTTTATLFSNGGFQLASGSVVDWTTGVVTGTIDTGMSRLAAASVAIGNGLQGDFSGTVKAANYITSGTGLAVANVGANSCGTTAATIAGGNNAFVITTGTVGSTQCRVTFTFAATTEWDCAANDDTTTTAIRVTPVDTTHTDFLGTITAGDKISAICFPR